MNPNPPTTTLRGRARSSTAATPPSTTWSMPPRPRRPLLPRVPRACRRHGDGGTGPASHPRPRLPRRHPPPRPMRLDGIVRTVITLRCFRCAEPAPQGIFANFSLLLTEDPVEEPDVVDLGTIYEEDAASLTPDQDGQDVDWDDRLHFPAGDKEIDISKNIRDIVHLEITMDAVCSPSCKGLCLACGENLNTSSCGCSKERQREPKNVKGPRPLKELLKPIQKR